jgi:hypothetical protein
MMESDPRCEIKVKQIAVSGGFPENPKRCETCRNDCRKTFILLAGHFSTDPATMSSLMGLFMTVIAMMGCDSHEPKPNQSAAEIMREGGFSEVQILSTIPGLKPEDLIARSGNS